MARAPRRAKAAQLATYMDVFLKVGLSGVIVGVICLAVSPLLKKGMAGRT